MFLQGGHKNGHPFIYFPAGAFVIILSRKIMDAQYFISLLTMDLMGKMDFGMLVKKGAIT